MESKPDGYNHAGTIRFAYTDRRWVLGPMWVDDQCFMQDVRIFAHGDDGFVKDVRVRIPMSVVGDDLVIGEVEVLDASQDPE